jgi:hypothetical protein
MNVNSAAPGSYRELCPHVSPTRLLKVLGIFNFLYFRRIKDAVATLTIQPRMIGPLKEERLGNYVEVRGRCLILGTNPAPARKD